MKGERFWAKFELGFIDTAVLLSDAAFRVHISTLFHLYAVGDPKQVIHTAQLMRIVGCDVDPRVPVELVEKGFWRERGGGYAVVDHVEVVTVSMREQSDKRRGWREQKRKQRQGQGEPDPDSNVRADIPQDVRRMSSPGASVNQSVSQSVSSTSKTAPTEEDVESDDSALLECVDWDDDGNCVAVEDPVTGDVLDRRTGEVLINRADWASRL